MSQISSYFSSSVVLFCFVLFSMCVCACVCLWLFPYSGSLVGAIDEADNAHSLGTPARDMVETVQQSVG